MNQTHTNYHNDATTIYLIATTLTHAPHFLYMIMKHGVFTLISGIMGHFLHVYHGTTDDKRLGTSGRLDILN